MKRTLLWFLAFFAAGLAVGYGLAHLDRQARVPRLGPTEVFRVVLPDGTYRHLTYAEVERDRTELRQLRLALAQREAPRPAAPPEAPAREETAPQTPPPDPGGSAAAPQAVQEASRKKLGDLFAKIFSRPVMQEIALSQVKRQAGELSAVLGLTPSQRETLEAELARRRLEQTQGRGRSPAGRPGAPPSRGDQDLEAFYRTLFTPEQVRRYESYTEKKRQLGGQPVPEQELFELTWRLDLSDEQETRAAQVLRDQWEKLQQLSPTGGTDEDASPLQQFERYLNTRNEIFNRSTERLRAFLDEDQIAGFQQYVTEKEMETRLLEKMIRSETDQGEDASP